MVVHTSSIVSHPPTVCVKELKNSQIKKPSISHATGQPLFYQAPPQLYDLTKGNLEKLMVDLVTEGDEVVVTDPALPFTLNVVIKYT
jgi:ubiquitin-activating enzyme E1 C